MRLLLGLLLALPVLAQQSLTGGAGVGTLPTGAPWTSLTDYRIQLRLHDWAATGSYEYVYSTNAYTVRLDTLGRPFITSWADASVSCVVAIDPATVSDVIVVMQRDNTGQRLTCEAFSTATGALVAQKTEAITSPGTPNDSGQAVMVGRSPWSGTPSTYGRIAYVRTYNTVVSLGTAPGNTYDGSLTDYELNGNGTDTAGHANLTMSADTYATTAKFDPAAIANPWPTINTFRAPGSIGLSGASSFSATDNATLSYLWSKTSGPSGSAFSSATAAAPTLSATATGAYVIALTITDSDERSSSTSVTVGAVTADDSYIVSTGLSAAADSILGPLTMAGTSPWIYFDLAEIATGSNLATTALLYPPYRGAALSGTVTVGYAGGHNQLVGSGTHFLTELAEGDQIIVAWDSSDGPGTGNYVDGVKTILDDTHALVNLSDFHPAVPSAAKVYLVMPDTSTYQMSAWQNSNITTFWTFYDPPLAMYRLYFRTGDPTFQTQARQLADYQWEWMVDHGYATPVPRGAGLLSQFFRALDGKPERLPHLYALVQFLQGWQVDPYVVPQLDLREAGYVQWFEAVGSRVDTDPTRHAWYCASLSSNATNWIAAQYPYGSWGEDVAYLSWGSYPTAPLSYSPLRFGASPWRTTIMIKALEASYEALNDTGSQGCNNPTLATSLLATITKAVEWQWNYGRDNRNRGVFYEVNNPNDMLTRTTPAGTASVALGSTAVVGSGTSFTTAFSCNNTDFISFNLPAAPYSVTYKVVSCGDNEHLVINPAYGSYGSPLTETANAVGASIYRTPSSLTSCGAGSASFCGGAGAGDLNLVRLLPGATAWLYYQTGNSVYKARADEYFSTAFGGPVNGPDSTTSIGTVVSNPSGPNALGYIGDDIATLPDCAAPNPAPCVPGGSPANKGKNFGEAHGAPGADNALAWTMAAYTPPTPPTPPTSQLSGSWYLRGIAIR